MWKPFEAQFNTVLDSLNRHKALLETETTLAHRQHVEEEIKEQRLFRKATFPAWHIGEDNGTVVEISRCNCTDIER